MGVVAISENLTVATAIMIATMIVMDASENLTFTVALCGD